MSCKCKDNLPLPTSGVVDKYGLTLNHVLDEIRNDVSILKLSQEQQLNINKIFDILKQVTLNTVNIDFIKVELDILAKLIKESGKGGTSGEIPTKLSQLINDCGFITALTDEEINEICI